MILGAVLGVLLLEKSSLHFEKSSLDYTLKDKNETYFQHRFVPNYEGFISL